MRTRQQLSARKKIEDCMSVNMRSIEDRLNKIAEKVRPLTNATGQAGRPDERSEISVPPPGDERSPLKCWGDWDAWSDWGDRD